MPPLGRALQSAQVNERRTHDASQGSLEKLSVSGVSYRVAEASGARSRRTDTHSSGFWVLILGVSPRQLASSMLQNNTGRGVPGWVSGLSV